MEFAGNVQVAAGDAAALEEIFEVLRHAGIEPHGNPDVYVRAYGSFGVEEARDLSQRASARAISLRRVFIVVAPGMTSEAQNTRLKTLEEPSGDALFFFLVPSPQMLLPTFLSRAQILVLNASAAEPIIDPKEFMREKPEARVALLKPLLEKDDDDKRDLSSAISFLSALERNLGTDPKENREALAAVYRARKYIGDKGASVKTLLEHVAFLL